jgi:hypothetical protein
MKAHFLTFGGGSAWPHAARRLASQAQATGLFETVSVETGNEIFERWPEFAEHRPFVEANPRGWGYWLWKPFLLRSYLRRIQDGELLFYLDAGFEILVENKDRLQRLLQQSALNGALLFGCPQYPILNAIFWAKQDLLDRFAQNYGLKNLEQIPLVAAGSLALVKNKQNLALLDDWYSIGASEGGHLIDDSPSVATQKQLFIEHRHDQAIFDFLIVAHGIPATGSFLYYDYGREQADKWPALLNRPFLALRNPGAESQITHPRQPVSFRSRLALAWSERFNPASIRPLQVLSDELAKKHRNDLIELGL